MPAKEEVRTAIGAFSLWGAKRKVESLRQEFSQILNLIQLDGHEDIRGNIDFEALLTATQSLSKEINIDQLMAKFMQIVMQAGGATDGFFMLVQNERIQLKVQGGTSPDVWVKALHSNDNHSLPWELIDQAVRTAETITHQSNEAKDYGEKENIGFYILPISIASRVMAVVYLENRLSSANISEELENILTVLASQCTISIENAMNIDAIKNKEREIARLDSEIELAAAIQEPYFPTIRFVTSLIFKPISVLRLK